jgi:hypothetical protein
MFCPQCGAQAEQQIRFCRSWVEIVRTEVLWVGCVYQRPITNRATLQPNSYFLFALPLAMHSAAGA